MYPVLFRIGDIAISSYTVMFIIGFLLAYLPFRSEFKRKGLSEDLLDLLYAASVIGGLIGAKILFLMENVTFREFMTDPIRYLSSGLTFLGGFLGAVVLILVVVWAKKVNFWLVADAMSPALVLGYSIAKIGCFLVGDDYGPPSHLPWAMAFPEGSPPTNERVHPAQIYEMLAMIGVFVFLWKIRKRNVPIGWLFGVTLILMGVERFLVEFVRNTTPSFIPRVSLAQLMSFGLIVGGALRLLKLRIRETV